MHNENAQDILGPALLCYGVLNIISANTTFVYFSLPYTYSLT